MLTSLDELETLLVSTDEVLRALQKDGVGEWWVEYQADGRGNVCSMGCSRANLHQRKSAHPALIFGALPECCAQHSKTLRSGVILRSVLSVSLRPDEFCTPAEIRRGLESLQHEVAFDPSGAGAVWRSRAVEILRNNARRDSVLATEILFDVCRNSDTRRLRAWERGDEVPLSGYKFSEQQYLVMFDDFVQGRFAHVDLLKLLFYASCRGTWLNERCVLASLPEQVMSRLEGKVPDPLPLFAPFDGDEEVARLAVSMMERTKDREIARWLDVAGKMVAFKRSV